MKWFTLTACFFSLVLSIARAGNIGYVTNGGSVIVIDLDTKIVIDTINLLGGANRIAITPKGDFAYVTGDNVSVIRLSDNTVTATIPLEPSDIAITPDGTLAYVTGGDSVGVIDVSSNTVTNAIPVGASPFGIAFTPDGGSAYIANSSSNNVSVIDVSSNTVTNTIPVGTGPVCIAITPDGNCAYVTNQNGNVSVIDVSSNTVIATVTVETSPFCIAIRPQGDFAYVTNSSSNNVSVINLSSNTVIDAVSVGPSSFIAISPDGGCAYVITAGGISVIELLINAFIDVIPIPAIDIAITGAFSLNVRAETDRDHYFTQTDLFNHISWTTPEMLPTSYEIFANGKRLAVLPGNAIEHFDHNKSNGETTTYVIIGRKGKKVIASDSITITCE